ncbi:MAG: 4'-phosphopantetheinyl transferase superfamily protein [Crocosphaera sp.]
MDIVWKDPSPKLTINSQEIHLWKTNLQQSSLNIKNGFKILNQEEKIKAQKFHFEQHQQRFIIARSTLKRILSLYLSLPPETIEFQYSDHGKPQLVDHLNNKQLQFNLSHSQDLAIYAITPYYLIGVDVEYVRPMRDAENIAKRFFSAQEFQRINSLSPVNKNKEFLTLWTAKEAYLKAIGKGLSGGLETVEISSYEPRKFINLPDINKHNWTLLSFVPQVNYLAAMAVQDNQQVTTYFRT